MSDYQLPDGRLEQQLKDKRPPYNEAEAIAEANRCIYCSDAPCVVNARCNIMANGLFECMGVADAASFSTMVVCSAAM